LEIIKKFTFNKKKKETIILIHGLYTTSGFWLSFFKFFKNYRIIAFDIKYDKLLATDFSKDNLKLHFQVDGNIVAVISHSFGTVISDLLFNFSDNILHKTCPIGFSKRIESSTFVLDVLNKTALSEASIQNSMKLVKDFMRIYRSDIKSDGNFYIPHNDRYFEYNLPESTSINNFEGDHFDIKNALILIIDNLTKVTNHY